MKFLKSQVFWGAALIIIGLLVLGETLSIFAMGTVWALVFAVAAAFFLMTYITNQANWWALIPCGVLTAIAATIAVDAFFPNADFDIVGSLFLLCLGLSFLTIRFVTRGVQWWAMIPGGILTTLAIVVGLETNISGFNDMMFTGLMFLGFASTFALVALLPTADGRQRWGWWPAGIMGVMGVIFASTATHLVNYIWPVLLIGVGIYVLIRNVNR